MERKISLNDVQKAVDNAYEQFKSEKCGEVNDRVKDQVNVKDYGIAVVLTDGRVVKKADAETKFALGDIARAAVATVLMTQNTAEEVVKKSGTCCKCKGHHEARKLHLPIDKHALRATSAIEPTGDNDGKYNLLVNTIIDMTAGEPDFSDKLYKELTDECVAANVEDELAKAGYELYDDTQIAINVYNKLRSLRLTAEEVATLGATIAADGVNPKTNKVVFDGSKAANIVTLLATVGNKRRGRAALMKIGLPVLHSFAGGVLAVLPGFGAIAAYSPEICEDCHASAKGIKAVASIANELGLNIFASARVTVE